MLGMDGGVDKGSVCFTVMSNQIRAWDVDIYWDSLMVMDGLVFVVMGN